MVRDRMQLDAARAGSFELVIRGDTNKQAARALGFTERTVKSASPQGDGENTGPIAGGTCVPFQAGRRLGLCAGNGPAKSIKKKQLEPDIPGRAYDVCPGQTNSRLRNADFRK